MAMSVLRNGNLKAQRLHFNALISRPKIVTIFCLIKDRKYLRLMSVKFHSRHSVLS